MSERYHRPTGIHRITLMVSNSRFITNVNNVETVDAARRFLADIRTEMPDASHHVYAFRVGYGNSVIEGMSDDGEPSGTSGPPTLAVLRGFDIGDVIIVTTRYFGGTKLGTGGLVRAYSDAAREALNTLKTEEKVEKQRVGFEVAYTFYELTKRLIEQHHGEIEDETFAGEVTIIAQFPVRYLSVFADGLQELTNGAAELVTFNE